jgi:UDP-N-acetylglucosamine 1-carboxyvinyltransferase
MIKNMIEHFVINGGNPLRGEVDIRGAKNASTKMMVASLLTDEPCTLENVPTSADTDITKELLENVGSEVRWDAANHRCVLETKKVTNALVPKLSRRNRIPILAIGPLLHRAGQAEVPVEGGCPIGHRPINFHIEALRKMGAVVERREHSYYAQARVLHGADMALSYPSVGATETLLLTGVRAHGRTTIHNAAIEPEVLNLIIMLRDMGADIHVDEEKRFIEIRGVEKLHGTNGRVMPDRNEIISFAVAALATDGDVFIRNIEDSYLQMFLQKIQSIGGSFERERGGIRFFGKRPYHPTSIMTAPYPGFMTDWQEPFCVLLTQAGGESIIHETVYDDRFGYVADLARMGADIHVSNKCLGGESCRFEEKGFHHSAVVTGVTPLRGAEIDVTVIRAGMAYIIAALGATGESVITGIDKLDRGYERIDERLRELGANIKRV